MRQTITVNNKPVKAFLKVMEYLTPIELPQHLDDLFRGALNVAYTGTRGLAPSKVFGMVLTMDDINRVTVQKYLDVVPMATEGKTVSAACMKRYLASTQCFSRAIMHWLCTAELIDVPTISTATAKQIRDIDKDVPMYIEQESFGPLASDGLPDEGRAQEIRELQDSLCTDLCTDLHRELKKEAYEPYRRNQYCDYVDTHTGEIQSRLTTETCERYKKL